MSKAKYYLTWQPLKESRDSIINAGFMKDVRRVADFIMDEEVRFERQLSRGSSFITLTPAEFAELSNKMVEAAKRIVKSLERIPTEKLIIDSIIENYIANHDGLGIALCSDGSSRGWVRWGSQTKDMALLSLAFRDVLFVLEVEDEEADAWNGGFWREYYINGKVQVANGEVVFEDFDAAKLVPILDHA